MQPPLTLSVLSVFLAVMALSASAQLTGKPCSSCSKRNITDDVRACRKENPAGCQHVYLYRVIGGPANKMSCKYSLGGGQIYETGALPRELSEAEKQAVQKYHEEQKTHKCGVGKCPSMPCLCEDCPNRPKDAAEAANSTDAVDTTSDGFYTEPVFNSTDVTPTEFPFNSTSDGASSEVSEATPSTDASTSDGSGRNASNATLEPGLGSSDDTTNDDGSYTGSALNSTDPTPADLPFNATSNDDPSTDSSNAVFSTDFLSSDGPKEASSDSTDVPAFESTDEPISGSTDTGTPALPSNASVEPPRPTNNPIINVATGPNGTVSVDVATGDAAKDGRKKQKKDGWWSQLKKNIGHAFQG